MKNFLLGVMSTVLCIVVLGANYQPQAVKKYEYANPMRHVVRGEPGPPSPSADGNRKELAFINKQAANSWRLIQIEYSVLGGQVSHLWFEREIR